MNPRDSVVLRLAYGTGVAYVVGGVGYGLYHLARDSSLVVVPAVMAALVVGLVVVGDLSMRAVDWMAARLDQRGGRDD